MRYLTKRNNGFFDLFDDFFEFPLAGKKNNMRVDIKENEENYQIDVELAGFKKEDIKIQLEDGYLTISAVRAAEDKEEEKGRIIRQERYYGEVSRSFYVGNYSEEEVNAKYENGVLTVTLPKSSQAENKKYITIE